MYPDSGYKMMHAQSVCTRPFSRKGEPGDELVIHMQERWCMWHVFNTWKEGMLWISSRSFHAQLVCTSSFSDLGTRLGICVYTHTHTHTHTHIQCSAHSNCHNKSYHNSQTDTPLAKIHCRNEVKRIDGKMTKFLTPPSTHTRAHTTHTHTTSLIHFFLLPKDLRLATQPAKPPLTERCRLLQVTSNQPYGGPFGVNPMIYYSCVGLYITRFTVLDYVIDAIYKVKFAKRDLILNRKKIALVSLLWLRAGCWYVKLCYVDGARQVSIDLALSTYQCSY